MAVEILFTNQGKLDCRSCDDRLKEERGHYKNGIIPYWVEGKQVFRCPLTFVTQSTWEFIKAYNLMDKGFLPNGVAWNKESNKFIEAMNILDVEFTHWKNKVTGNAGNRTGYSPKGHR